MSKSNLWTYYCDSVEYKRLNKPEAWSNIDENNMSMFKSYPDFEFIPGTRGEEEPIRYGDFILDIDTKEQAIDDAKRIIAHFQEIHGVDSDEWEIYLSGKKGIHLSLSDKVFGIESGHKLLTLGYKRLAKDLEGDIGINIDCSMYNKGSGKPFRQANVLRQDTNTYKVQVTFDELEEVTDDYIELCSQPRSTWPVIAKHNNRLSNILKSYIERFENEDLKQTPLSAEQIESLKEAPQCMKFLSTLGEQIKGSSATFNDIAIQLTAYALSAGFNEKKFLSACSFFINNYPSTSLTSPQKRLENVVNRYRNMASSGSYAHSCGGVMALGIREWTCNSCHYKKVLIKESICSVETLCYEASRSTCIPSELLQNKGLISLGLEAAKLWSGLEIIQYNLPVVIAHIATSIAGKIRYDNIHPSFFIIKIGTTSTGKSDSDKYFKNNISSSFDKIETIDGKEVKKNTFYGANDYSSGPAIFRSISKNLKSLSVMDEIKFFFESGKSFDPNAQGKKQAILELSTSAGQTYRKTYSDSGNDIVLEYPVINLIGNATESIFNAFTLDDMESGLIQRFDFFCYEGKTPYRIESDIERTEIIGSQFVDEIVSLRNIDFIGYYLRHKIDYDMKLQPAVNIGMTEEAEKLRIEYSHHIIDIVNSHDDGGKKGIINRAYQTAIKLALVHAGANRYHGDDFFQPLTKKDLQWGIDLADILYKWKLDVFVENLSSGDFDKLCESFLKACKTAHRNNQKPSGSVLINRSKKLKNLNSRQWDEVVKVLLARKQIVVTTGSPTLYYPAK